MTGNFFRGLRMRNITKIFLQLEQTCLTPRNILLLSAGFGILFTLLHVLFLNETYRDVGNCYATFTRIFAEGGFREALNPGLPILPILMAGTLSLVTGLEAFRSLILIDGFFYVALIAPLYWFLKRFVSSKLAAWGVFACLFAPKIIRFSLCGLPEPARNFFLVLSVLLVFSIFDKPKFYKTVLLGLALAGFTLSRSEGILISIMMLGTMFLFQLFPREKPDWRRRVQTALFCTCSGFLFFLLFLSPRMYLNYQTTGYPTPDCRLDRYIQKYLTPSRPLWSLEEKGRRYTDLSLEIHRKPFSVLKQLRLQFKQLSRGAYELYLVFLALGLLSAWFADWIRRHLLADWQPAADPRIHGREYLFLLVVLLMHAAVYFPLQTSYRYYTFAIPLFLPLTLGGVKLIWELGCKFHLQVLLALVILGLAAAQAVNGLASLTDQKPEYRAAGEWIRRNLGSSGKKLKILNYHGYVVYWINGKIMNPYYGGPTTKPEYASDFDIAIAEPDNLPVLNVLRSRKDVVELDHPHKKTVAVFRKRN